MGSYIDPTAACEAEILGPESRVLALARIGSATKIGAHCLIGDQAVLEGEITLSDRVMVHAGARLQGPVSVGRGAVIGINALLTGTDPVAGISEVQLGPDVLVGACATLLPGVVVGRSAIVKPGSVVIDNVPANAVVSGNPAKIVAYVDSIDHAGTHEVVVSPHVGVVTTETTSVPGVTLHRLTSARDLRGALTAADFSDLPFSPSRLFMVYDVPSESVRGSHAHRTCAQFLICAGGILNCVIDDGSAREEIRLADPNVGLHIPPMVWGTQWNYTRNALLLVLASHPYEPDDYIRDYEEFLLLLGRDDVRANVR